MIFEINISVILYPEDISIELTDNSCLDFDQSKIVLPYLCGEGGDVTTATGLADADAGDGVAGDRRRQELPLQLVTAETEAGFPIEDNSLNRTFATKLLNYFKHQSNMSNF